MVLIVFLGQKAIATTVTYRLGLGLGSGLISCDSGIPVILISLGHKPNANPHIASASDHDPYYSPITLPLCEDAKNKDKGVDKIILEVWVQLG